MIGTLDRYVLTKFNAAYAIVVIVILLLYVIVDVPERLKRARREGCGRTISLGQPQCHQCNTPIPKGSKRCPKPTSNEILLVHYCANIPLMYYQFAPFLVVLAGMLTVSFFQQRNELIPMRNAGRSPLRIVLPILIVALILGAFTWTIQEYFIPKLHVMVQQAGLIGKNKLRYPKPIPDKFGGILFAENYNAEDKSLNAIVYQRLSPEGHEIYEIVAKRAQWLQNGSQGNWILFDGVQCQFNKNGQRQVDHQNKITTKVFTKDFSLQTSILPRDIYEMSEALGTLSSAELREQQKRLPHDKQRMAVLLEGRFSYPFAGFILLFLGLPFVLDENGNSWKGIFACLVICGIYYIFSFILLDLAKVNLINARLGAWLPNLTFFPLGLALMRFKAN